MAEIGFGSLWLRMGLKLGSTQMISRIGTASYSIQPRVAIRRIRGCAKILQWLRNRVLHDDWNKLSRWKTYCKHFLKFSLNISCAAKKQYRSGLKLAKIPINPSKTAAPDTPDTKIKPHTGAATRPIRSIQPG